LEALNLVSQQQKADLESQEAMRMEEDFQEALEAPRGVGFQEALVTQPDIQEALEAPRGVVSQEELLMEVELQEMVVRQMDLQDALLPEPVHQSAGMGLVGEENKHKFRVLQLVPVLRIRLFSYVEDEWIGSLSFRKWFCVQCSVRCYVMNCNELEHLKFLLLERRLNVLKNLIKYFFLKSNIYIYIYSISLLIIKNVCASFINK
jgi:hypothetical protein